MKEDQIILRDATISDLDNVVQLFKQLYTVEYRIENKMCSNLKSPDDFFNSKGFKKEISYKRKCIRNKKIKFIVATYNEKVIGYTTGYVKNHPAYISKVLFGDEIVVNDQFQKNGIGDLLIKELVKWGKRNKAKEMMFYAFRDNKPAMSKYVNMGFKERHICMYKSI